MVDKTPVEKQYYNIKKEHLDKILMFQMGDFYEMFGDDAIIAAKILNIQLTARKKKEKKTPMCGVPLHSSEQYIHKLVQAGYKVALCRQMEQPNGNTKVVDRQVVRVITPSTILNEDYLQRNQNNYLASVVFYEQKIGICYSDFSTGDFFIDCLQNYSISGLWNSLNLYQPKEILLKEIILKEIKTSKEKEIDYFQKKLLTSLNRCAWFELQKNIQYLEKDFFTLSQNKSLVLEQMDLKFFSSTGLADYPQTVIALGVVIAYLQQIQRAKNKLIQNLQWVEKKNQMHLDSSTMEHLHLFPTSQKNPEINLYDFLNHTITDLGARLLRKWIAHPLLKIADIQNRQEVIVQFLKNPEISEQLKNQLKNIYDLERMITRIFLGQFWVSDLRKIRASLAQLPPMQKLLQKIPTSLVQKYLEKWENLSDLQQLLQEAINDAPTNQKEGGYIREGYHQKLDEIRKIAFNNQSFIEAMEKTEREKTKIPNLKIRSSRNAGLFIEVSNSYKNLTPQNYTRKQTLTNCERFITSELQEMEEKIWSANEEIVLLEEKILSEIIAKLCQKQTQIQKMAKIIAAVDCLQALALVTLLKNYTKPLFFSYDKIQKLAITSARHPLVEEVLQDEPFIANDLFLDQEQNYIQIITGPNMGGKSTYMRQIALLIIMSQIGCFVAAQEAKISIFEKIFTRVGASDNILGGESTFMVEMNEVAVILRNSTSKSFIILDEIGRGTSTYDGISIACAIVEFLQTKKTITLFATHYHELVQLGQDLVGVLNTFVLSEEKDEEVVFLKKIQKGFSQKSYGIQVANLAGLPPQVIQRALNILQNLEKKSMKKPLKQMPQQKELFPVSQPLCKKEQTIIQGIKNFSVENSSPLDALNFLCTLKKKLENDKKDSLH